MFSCMKACSLFQCRTYCKLLSTYSHRNVFFFHPFTLLANLSMLTLKKKKILLSLQFQMNFSILHLSILGKSQVKHSWYLQVERECNGFLLLKIFIIYHLFFYVFWRKRAFLLFDKIKLKNWKLFFKTCSNLSRFSFV